MLDVNYSHILANRRNGEPDLWTTLSPPWGPEDSSLSGRERHDGIVSLGDRLALPPFLSSTLSFPHRLTHQGCRVASHPRPGWF